MDIASWLRGLSLEKYIQVFADNDIDSEILPTVTADELIQIGISSLGHRRKLLNAIAALQKEPEREEAVGEEKNVATHSSFKSESTPTQAERRQITVMFVDLVGSTNLSTRLDPEDLRTIIADYQNIVAQAVSGFQGHVAKYMGDGVLCYFGWPRSHEDDPERAVRTSLSILAAIRNMTVADGEHLSVRIGIATGLVVIGDLVGSGAAQEEAVTGETPNLAGRLQGIAEPGQVVISEATRRLIGDTFDVTSLGPQSLKGFPKLLPAFAVSSVRAAESRFASRVSGTLTPLVGRDHELGLVVERWKQANSGEGQLVLVIGEAGIGKSRLTRGMIDTASAEEHIRLSYQCSPYHSDSTLYPAVQQIIFAAGFAKDDTNDDMLDRLESTLVGPESDRPFFAALLGLEYEPRYGELDLTPRQLRTRTLEVLTRQLLALASKKPVLFVVEDVHWIDATTLELLDLCLDLVATSRVMILVTARPTFQHGFGGHPIVTKLALNRLGREQAMNIVSRLAGGKAVPSAVIDIIAAKTDGVPLFIEEYTKTILESGELRDTGDAYELLGPLNHLTIPSSLYDSLISRLDRLKPVKEIAQVAACIGRNFDYSLLQAVAPVDEDALRNALTHLVEAELIFQRGEPPDATYIFKHALLRDAAYDTLLKTRRQTIHSKLLTALEQKEADPEILAHHAAGAGQTQVAASYLLQAGQQAAARSANKEAINYLEAGIALLDGISQESEKQKLDLGLHSALASVLMLTQGYASEEVGRVATRALELCRHIGGDVAVIAPTMWQAWLFHYTSANHKAAETIGYELLQRAKESGNSVIRIVADVACGLSSFALGNLVDAGNHFEHGAETRSRLEEIIVQPGYGFEVGTAAVAYASWVQGMLGFVDQSRKRIDALVPLVEKIGHPFTTSRGLYWCCAVSATLKDWATVLELEKRSTEVSIQYEFQMTLYIDQVLRGVASSYINPQSAWMNECSDGLNAYQKTGARVQVPFMLALVAEALLDTDEFEEGLSMISEAITLINATGEVHVASEVYRLQGDLLQKSGEENVAHFYQKALSIAREQGARLFELRAAMSLARLWAAHGRQSEARDLLGPIYEWFTEGFDTHDLKEAKALLDAFRSSESCTVEVPD